jgi:cell division protein FtsI/penicillin-binding protein 2
MVRFRSNDNLAMRNLSGERHLHTALCCTCIAALVMVLSSPSRIHSEDRFQASVNEIMRGTGGAVIASDPRSGRILAVWNRQVVFQQTFPPGSTAKLVISAMALENNLITTEEKLNCRRVPPLLGEAYHCSHPEAFEPFTITTALANSCNYFFAALSTRLDAATLQRGYTMFGFGTSSTQEARPALRISSDPAAKARAALGEKPVLVTPAELLMAYSAVATRGSVWRLQQGKASPPSILRTVQLKLSTWQTLDEGLEECVRAGTCQAAAIPGIRVAGKTGTAGVSDGSGFTHAWFAGYAPVGAPEIAIVVFLGRGTGARDAAPLAGRILRQYFALREAR